jgi:hypothetical protein
LFGGVERGADLLPIVFRKVPHVHAVPGEDHGLVDTLAVISSIWRGSPRRRAYRSEPIRHQGLFARGFWKPRYSVVRSAAEARQTAIASRKIRRSMAKTSANYTARNALSFLE